MGNNIRSSSRPKALAPSVPMPPLADAMDAVHLSVDRFCLLAGVEALAEMMEEDATTVCGAEEDGGCPRRGHHNGRRVRIRRRPSPPEGCGRALPPPAASMERLCLNRQRTWRLSWRTTPISRPSDVLESQSIGRWTSTRCSGRRSRTQLPASYVRRLNPKPMGMSRPPDSAWC